MPHHDTKVEVDQGENIYRNIYSGTTQRFETYHILAKWKGSCFKLIWHELAIFLAMYFALTILYRHVIFDYPTSRQTFELICIYAENYSRQIPLTFLIGFYVSSVVSRWWDQFMTLPRPDKFALLLVNFIPGQEDFHKNLRRTIIRYVNVSTVLVYRLVAGKVMRRFPDYDALVEAKLLLPHEAVRLRKVHNKTPYESTWTPLLWASKLITKARKEEKISITVADFATTQKAISEIDGINQKLLNYGWVNFPLAYVHVVTISVHLYFLAALFGRQYLLPHEDNTKPFTDVNIAYTSNSPFTGHLPDMIIPCFTIIEFFCYIGWIKVAQSLLNPFGDDDEDFKINYLIDRNLQVSYLIVDEADKEMEMGKDPFLEAGIEIPSELPYANPDEASIVSNKTTHESEEVSENPAPNQTEIDTRIP